MTNSSGRVTQPKIPQKKTPQFNFSTDKALAILEYLSSAHEPVRLNVLSADLNLNNSTASRFLKSLEKNGYVQQEEGTKRYFITNKICTLSYKVLANNNIIFYAKPLGRIFANLDHEGSFFRENCRNGW